MGCASCVNSAYVSRQNGQSLVSIYQIPCRFSEMLDMRLRRLVSRAADRLGMNEIAGGSVTTRRRSGGVTATILSSDTLTMR